jgi:hypothetical protein
VRTNRTIIGETTFPRRRRDTRAAQDTEGSARLRTEFPPQHRQMASTSPVPVKNAS